MLVLLRAQENPSARLICFPHAGGSASAFHAWVLPDEFEVWAVQPPGRGPRFAEQEISVLDLLRDEIIEALRPTIDNGVPFVFFGHSFGSLVAFEVARALSDRSLTLPMALLVSASPAPGTALPDTQARLSQSPTDTVCMPPCDAARAPLSACFADRHCRTLATSGRLCCSLHAVAPCCSGPVGRPPPVGLCA
jgi:surfactin synthase thioesterase subunit